MDIEIFPHRLLGADTTEKLLNDLEEIESIKRMVIQGQRLPPAEEGHPDRRMIKISGQEVELQVKPGRVLLEVEDESAIDDIKKVCEEHLPFGFEVHIGKFIRTQKTVTDELKYGELLDEIPDELIGLTDPNARLTERATIIKKKKEKREQ
ncbi:methyl-coenzyme M reductase operon protein D [Methanothermobacter tenebrarum]|uniref:Methyl-coenzyme M reductase operon protein D n=1 Tax=Methanothermobacter tenebrarum TaxID=680118 RepID=A0A328PI59_9EURY|nr:methyl-coenzyme M reductase operon protein D [Methanothermobacter tenebrarum]NPV65177.1 methyl-coenzyme M reductase operon protein D [Methanobacteriaceae archaeon]RAO79545.1 methyl-coenzyme M reductase operon protein D [Methanothermobacter tenebrarum]